MLGFDPRGGISTISRPATLFNEVIHMYYCENCKSVFDEEDLEDCYETVTTDPYPMGYSYAVCPYCHSDDFCNAVQCDGCGEYIVGEYIKLYNKECYCEDCYEICDTSDN